MSKTLRTKKNWIALTRWSKTGVVSLCVDKADHRDMTIRVLLFCKNIFDGRWVVEWIMDDLMRGKNVNSSLDQEIKTEVVKGRSCLPLC